MSEEKPRKNQANLELTCLYVAYSTCSAFGYFKSLRPLTAFLWTHSNGVILSGLCKTLATAACVFLGILMLDYYFELWCDHRPIRGIPRIPGRLPLVGNFFQHGPSAAMTYWKWGHPVFQLRLGTRRVVVANTYEAIYQLWQNNLKANISRPCLYTFHKVMSTSQGTTVGTTPFSESWKRMRKVIAANLNAAAIKSYSPIIDRQTSQCVRRLQSTVGKEIDVHSYLATFALCIVT